MWVSINSIGEERIHSYEPYYNRLQDKWQTTNNVDAPKGTYELFEKITHKPMAIFIDSVINDKAIVKERLKIH